MKTSMWLLERWLRRFAVAKFFTCAIMLTGCTEVAGVGTGGTGSGDTASAVTVVSSQLPRNHNPAVSDADLAAVVAGNTSFALSVFPRLNNDPDANAVFSPYSVTMAAALLAPGAAGTTLNGIEQALSFPLPQDRLNPALNKMNLLLEVETSGSGTDAPALNNVSAVWGQQGATILSSYLDTLAVNYGAGFHEVDFQKAPEGARLAINNWAANQTNNRIQNLIPQGGLSPATRLMLTNALWFKAAWSTAFESVGNNGFTNRDGSVVAVPFIAQSSYFPYAAVDGCQAVEIPYVGEKLSMLVILPTPDTFDTFASGFSPAVVADITSNLSTSAGMIGLSMPKFSFSSTVGMGEILKSLGMAGAFNPLTADFSGIDGSHDLHVDGVFHQAFIAVDHNGTEAASGTGIGNSGGGMGGTHLTVDHPFIFLIRERSTGLILFIGKVVHLS